MTLTFLTHELHKQSQASVQASAKEMPRVSVTRRNRKMGRRYGKTTQKGYRRIAIARGRSILRRRRYRNIRTGGYLGIEYKFKDYGFTGGIQSPTDATGGEVDPSTALALNSIAQGDGESEREGRQVSLVQLHLQGVVTCPAQADQTATETPPIVFIAVVLDTQTNGAQLNSEDVYTNPGGTVLTGSMPLRDLQYSQRFKTLATKTLSFPPYPISYDGTNIEQGGLSRSFEIHLPLKGIKTTYTNTTAVVASIADNSIHVIAYASTGSATLSYNSRIRFVG